MKKNRKPKRKKIAERIVVSTKKSTVKAYNDRLKEMDVETENMEFLWRIASCVKVLFVCWFCVAKNAQTLSAR